LRGDGGKHIPFAAFHAIESSGRANATEEIGLQLFDFFQKLHCDYFGVTEAGGSMCGSGAREEQASGNRSA
jgi:hypothetical protein